MSRSHVRFLDIVYEIFSNNSVIGNSMRKYSGGSVVLKHVFEKYFSSETIEFVSGYRNNDIET